MQFSSFNSIKETNSVDNPLFYTNNSDYSSSTYYKPYSSGVFGVGTNIKRVFISLRYITSLESIMNNGFTPVDDGLYNSNYDPIMAVNHSTIQFTIEYYFPFFAFGRASCGGKGFNFFKGVDSGYYWGRGNANYYD